MRKQLLRGRSLLWLLVLGTCHLFCQSSDSRSVAAIAAASDGSLLFVAIADFQLAGGSVLAIAASSNRIVWQHRVQHTPTTLTVSPDNRTLAAGFAGVPESDAGVLLYATESGKQTGSLGIDADLGFLPGEQYAAWGNGIVGLAFSPDQAVLYGVSNDDLFAWDMQAKRYLWVVEIPADPGHAKDSPELIALGHTSGLALSPNGKQLAVARGMLRITSAGRMRPAHFIQRGGEDKKAVLASGPVFSSDSRILTATYVAASNSSTGFSKNWIGSSLKPTQIPDCEAGVMWMAGALSVDMFGCQNESGAHLRNIHDPLKNVGAAAPAGNLPLLRVGNSLWSTDYSLGSWKNPTTPFILTLGELGTGKRLILTLPGR